MGENLLVNFFETAAVLIFGIGFAGLMLHRNLIKKIIDFNFMDASVYLFLAAKGYVYGRKAPIVVDGVQSMEQYINPVPAGLVLTGIVVSVSVTAFFLAVTVRLYQKYHSLDLNDIMKQVRKEKA